ncbi:hypothetical protein Acr_00g0060370 [Actinidia rufa]|uniref:RNase H type-1 domain-containing protein n=1 Tax=Actinidia rufa TaxID=165716 RepID=A0A7J0DNL1_9ERIC|nr:hypothetical protein Acr_00g0060370 [Actinidia rufa]
MAIKAQALADFIVESTHEGTPQPETASPETIVPEEPTPEEDLAHWKLFMDGSSNQHDCGAGLVIQTPSGEQMEYTIRMGFKATNNEAEYEALLAGLRVAVELGAQSLEIFSDSQLVVNQVQGDYFTKDARMMAYLGKVKAASTKLEFKIHQIPREDNKKADALANLASTFEFISDRCIPLEFLASPSIGIANQILQPEESPTWMDEIVAYLQKGTLPKDKLQARRLHTEMVPMSSPWPFAQSPSHYKMAKGILVAIIDVANIKIAKSLQNGKRHLGRHYRCRQYQDRQVITKRQKASWSPLSTS